MPSRARHPAGHEGVFFKISDPAKFFTSGCNQTPHAFVNLMKCPQKGAIMAEKRTAA